MAKVTQASRRRISFVEVRRGSVDPRFLGAVQAALQVLRTSPTAVAKQTLKAITSGRVRLDEMTDLTKADFLRLRTEVNKWRVGLKVGDYTLLQDLNSRAHRAITKVVDGFMWDNRVYIVSSLSPTKLASILVHEVNHVLNESEEHYRRPKAAFIEEYRACYAEKLFARIEMTPERCNRLKRAVIANYELKGVTPDDVPDVPPWNKVTSRAKPKKA